MKAILSVTLATALLCAFSPVAFAKKNAGGTKSKSSSGHKSGSHRSSSHRSKKA